MSDWCSKYLGGLATELFESFHVRSFCFEAKFKLSISTVEY